MADNDPVSESPAVSAPPAAHIDRNARGCPHLNDIRLRIDIALTKAKSDALKEIGAIVGDRPFGRFLLNGEKKEQVEKVEAGLKALESSVESSLTFAKAMSVTGGTCGGAEKSLLHAHSILYPERPDASKVALLNKKSEEESR